MKHINYLLLLISISFLYTLLITTNSPLTLQTQSWIHATSSGQEDINQEETQTSSENEDGPDETNSESELSQGNSDSDQSEDNSNRNDDNDDASSTNQNTNCPNMTQLSKLPLYIGQDGCQYPCPSVDSNDQGAVPKVCPTEPTSTSQSNTEASVKNEENPTQSPSQEQQEVEQPQQQQNNQDSSNQNAFVSPSINSDTSTAISNSEGTTSIKSFDSASTLKPGPGQTEFRVPSILNDPSKPFTPGGGNPQLEGIPKQPNTNPQTPLNPGNVPTNIPAKGYVTVITKVLGFYNGVQASYFEVCVDSTVIIDGKEHNTDASPPCATGSGLGTKYTVQAPGNIGIGVKNLRPVSYMEEHPLSMYIDAYESKTFTIYISPYPS
ncbi:MAG TPA: hypothetical protein VJU13_01310 [Candidatus Nitrosocosmicus sp.]|nr:hypothetical protein [Candidatus Nitrosocosmicus sp.]